MAKLDKLLELMRSNRAERALLVSNEPIRFYMGKVKREGPLLPAAHLGLVMEEILPTTLQPVYRRGEGHFHFIYDSPHGNFGIAVANENGTLQVTIEPIVDLPAVEEPVSEAPVVEVPVVEVPMAEVPIVEEPVKVEPAKVEPAKVEPAKVEPAKVEPAKVEPAKEKPVVQKPAAKKPATEAPPPVPVNELIERPAPKPAVVPTVSNEDFISSPWSTPAEFGDETQQVIAIDPDYCVLHPTEHSAGICAYSEKPYCRDCLVEINGRFYGKENLDKAMAPKRKSGSKRAPISSPNGGPSKTDATELDESQLSHRSRTKAGLLGIFLGVAGAHRIYLGYTVIGIAIPVIAFVLMFSLGTVTLALSAFWGFVEGIVIINGGMKDAKGKVLRD